MTETSGRRLSRRHLLALAGAGLATAVLGSTGTRTFGTESLRIGLVLPTRTGSTPVRAATLQTAGESISRGAVLAAERQGPDAPLPSPDLELRIATAPDDDAALRAAERLAAAEEVHALVGGVGTGQARALREVAARRRIPFLNVAAASDRLRGEARDPHTFHVEASASAYLHAVTGWFGRAGARSWFLVSSEASESEALRRSARRSIGERPSAVERLDEAVVLAEERSFHAVQDAIRAAEPDVVLLLVDAAAQLDFLVQANGRPLGTTITGFPHAVSQTRPYFAALRAAAPKTGRGPRAALWHPDMTPDAAALASRYLGRWGASMDAPAWAGHAAVTILRDAVAGGAVDAAGLLSRLQDPGVSFELPTGGRASFRARDRQLVKPLAVVRLDPDASGPDDPVEYLDSVPAPAADPAGGLPSTSAERSAPARPDV